MAEQTVRPPWVRLAAATLTAAARGRYAEASRLGQELADECGPGDIPHVMCAWIDTVLAQAGVPSGGGQIHTMMWIDEGSGAIHQADEVPPAARWAGRLFIARANMDQATFEALIKSVQSDEEWSRNVSAVLEQSGAQLRQLGWPEVVR